MKICLKLVYLVLAIAFCSTSLIFSQPQIKWSFSTDSCVYSSPAYNNGAIFIGSDDGNLYCLNAETGEKKWEFKTAGIIRCKPAIENGFVIVASDDGFLYALDEISGAKKWEYNIGNKINRIVPDMTSSSVNSWDYMQSSPVVNNGIVYVGSGDSSLYAIESQTGMLKWRTKTNGLIRSTPCVYNNEVFAGSFDGYIYSLNTEDGSQVWKFKESGSVQPSPRISDGILYCGSRNCFFNAINTETGKEIWKYDYSGSWVESSAAIVDSIVYVGSSDRKRVFAFKAKTGKIFWSLGVSGNPWSSPCYSDGTIYIGLGNYGSTMKTMSGGAMIAINASTGKQIWKLDCGQSLFIGGVVSSPLVNNNVVYYGSLDGKVYAVNTPITSIKNEQGDVKIPDGYKIGSYPNPFNPQTKIQFAIPESRKVNLSVFDSLGRLVAELLDKELHQGTYEVTFNAGSLSSGVYYTVLKAGNVIKTCKVIYLE